MDTDTIKPVYIETFQKGLLERKISHAKAILKECVLCPRQCRVDRTKGETGVCKTGALAVVSSFNAHFGEESPLVGSKGSGTIFFTHCNLMCNFCQNYDISHEGHGEEVNDAGLARIMLYLQQTGCHNINFVTPSHVVPQILSSLEIAIKAGLSVPLVYNTSAYDTADTLKLLEGVVDIYMPDFKFWDPGIAKITCKAPDYPEIARNAIREMHRQTGDLVIDPEGIARRGLLIRHLVLPGDLAGTRPIMRFIAKGISPNTYVNIMPQYRPCGRAHETPGLSRNITDNEYRNALRSAQEEGITRLDQRVRRFVVF